MIDIYQILKNALLNITKAEIRKDGDSSKPWCIYSKNGKNLGCFSTKDEAIKRLKEIEYFKNI